MLVNIKKWMVGAVMVMVVLATAMANAHSAPKTLLVVGDSLSAEYGIARGSGWVALLEQRLAARKIGARVVNASISGDTTSGGRTRLPALLKQHKPQVVIIELGANDALRGLSLAATEDNLASMTKLAQQHNAKVLLVGMRLPPNYGPAYSEQFFGMYGKVARSTGAALVPFMLEGVADKAALFQQDRMHPTAQAHPIILNTIWPHLAALLKQP